MDFIEHRIPASDGLRLYVRDYGDPKSTRTPLLCLTGITRNSKDFDDLARRYAPDRRVVVPEYRGRGSSDYDPDWHHYVPMVYLGDIVTIMATLGLTRVVVVGTSLGGLMAMGLHMMKPDAVAGIVLNDIGPELGPGTGGILDRIAVDQPQPDWPSAVQKLKATSPPLSIHDEAGWLAFAHRIYRQGDDGLIHVDWDTNLTRPLTDAPMPDLWALFRALRDIPVMVVRGGVSDILSADGLRRMVQVKPDLVVVTVPGIGHTPFLDEPIVQGPLDDFIARF